MIETLNFLLALGGIVLILVTAILVYDFKTKREIEKPISRFGAHTALLLTGASSVMTLIYSEVFLFQPCGLCWLQRVFLYPQVFILTYALYKKDSSFIPYGIMLSIPGLFVALYQHYLQMGGSEFITCPSAGGADCSERILFEFGFMTFPLMSASLFLFLIVLYYYMSNTTTNSAQTEG